MFATTIFHQLIALITWSLALKYHYYEQNESAIVTNDGKLWGVVVHLSYYSGRDQGLVPC